MSRDDEIRARMLQADIDRLLKAQAEQGRAVDAMLKQIAHLAELQNAQRRELAELRHPPTNTPEGKRMRLVQTFDYKPPQERAPTMTDTVKLYASGHAFVNGTVEHVSRARLPDGSVVSLPCPYNHAVRFVSLPTLNRRKHWRGETKHYGAMLQLCARLELVERVGKAWRWVSRFDRVTRLEWVHQFRPPARVR